MDEQTDDLIRQLCTQIGIIMEDEAETALIWNDAVEMTPRARLDRLTEAGEAISMLARAANVLIRRSQA